MHLNIEQSILNNEVGTSSDACEFYLRGTRFESQLYQWLFWGFHDFPYSLQANSGPDPYIRTWVFPCTFFPVHSSLSYNFLMICSMSYWQHTTTNELLKEFCLLHNIPPTSSGPADSKHTCACYLIHFGFLFDLFFNTEDEGDVFLRNVSWI
jgi:hypothetical protein